MCVSRILNMKVHIFTDIIKGTDPRYTQLFYLLSIINRYTIFQIFLHVICIFALSNTFGNIFISKVPKKM